MMERLKNDLITQRIMDTNSDLKRYLNLGPSLVITPPKPKTTYSSNTSILPTLFPRPTISS
jgi:hypothetical protein